MRELVSQSRLSLPPFLRSRTANNNPSENLNLPLLRFLTWLKSQKQISCQQWGYFHLSAGLEQVQGKLRQGFGERNKPERL